MEQSGAYLATFVPAPSGSAIGATLTSTTFAVQSREIIDAPVNVYPTLTTDNLMRGWLSIEWLDAAGTVVATSAGNLAEDVAAWQSSGPQATAPSGLGVVSARIALHAQFDAACRGRTGRVRRRGGPARRIS